MTIILFLIDTSSSMCQKALVNGVQKTYLDIAKGAVETFLKYRQRTQDCMGDRYMLLTFEEPPSNVKAGWKENHATFMNELKNLQSTGLTSMGESLKNAFDLLNLNRMQSGIDTYGQGRCPFYLEPSVIIVITDGGRYSYRNGVHQEIILPLNTQIPGTKFTKEPFRWDQRLFSLVLRMSGNRMEERVEGKVPHDDSPIERMCEVTGGRSYRVRSHYVLNQCIESLVQKVQPGVVLQFEPMLPKDLTQIPNEALQDIVFPPTKKMIYVPKHISQKTFPIGYWPLPEPYWPDPKALTLPPRDAHPKLKIVTPAVDEPQMVRNFPVDKYEIEASPLTLQILQKREMNKCWQVIISNGMHGFELPFGYLKATPNFSQVHLYVLAYNYPALLPLLHDLIHKYNMSPPNDLMYKFNAYVRSIPPYYCPFLRKALLNINVPYPLLQFLLPENVDNYLSQNIANQLKHIKNTAKQDQENLCMKVYKQLKQPKPPYRQIETAKLNPGVPLRRELVRHPLLRDTFAKLHAEIEPLENYTIVVPQLTRQASAKSYRNPFDIPRRDLIEDISRMRETFLRPTPTSLIAKDSGHCLPISEMGNYQEYLKNKDIPLRELEPTNVRQHMFGNPYKKDKHMVMVDEADLSEVAPMKAGNNGGTMPLGGAGLISLTKKLDVTRTRKRKAGPIRKDFVFRRLSTDVRPSGSSGSNCGSSSGSSLSGASSIGGSLENLSTMAGSDYDDDTASETSSISSGGMSDDSDTERTMEVFDFNEGNGEQEFALNGFVHNFINGNDESCESNEMNTSAAAAAAAATAASNLNAVTSPIATNNGHIVMPATIATAAAATTSLNLISQNALTNGPVNNNNQSVPASALTSSNIAAYLAAPYGGGGGGGVVVGGTQALELSTAAPGATTTHNLGNLAPPGGVVAMLPHSNLYSTLQINGNAAATLTTAAYANNVALPALAPVIVSPVTAAMSQTASINNAGPTPTPPTAVMAASTAPVPATTTTTTPTPAPMPMHSDINDAQEISRILQQCHNGGANTNNIGNSYEHDNNKADYDSHLLLSSTASTTAALTVSPAAMFSTLTLAAGSASTNVAAAATLSNSFDSLKRESTLHPHPQHHVSNHLNHNQNHAHINHNTTNTNTTTTTNSNLNHQQQHNNHKRRNNGLTPLLTTFTLSEEQRDAARKHNLELRAQIFRDIRRPGRDYTQLLEHLSLVKGDAEMKSSFVQMCITESLRFRRRQMSTCIETWWEKQQKQLAVTHAPAALSPS